MDCSFSNLKIKSKTKQKMGHMAHLIKTQCFIFTCIKPFKLKIITKVKDTTPEYFQLYQIQISTSCSCVEFAVTRAGCGGCACTGMYSFLICFDRKKERDYD